MLHFNIYIGQSNYLKISSLGPPMVDPTPVSHSIAIIYFVARFFRLFMWIDVILLLLLLLITLFSKQLVCMLYQSLILF